MVHAPVRGRASILQDLPGRGPLACSPVSLPILLVAGTFPLGARNQGPLLQMLIDFAICF